MLRLAARSARSILSRSRLLRAESDSAPERARGRGGREVARALGCSKWLWSPLMGTAELGMWDGSGGKSVAEIARDFNPAVIGEVGGKLSIRTKAGGYPDPQVKQVLACQSIILFDKRKRTVCQTELGTLVYARSKLGVADKCQTGLGT